MRLDVAKKCVDFARLKARRADAGVGEPLLRPIFDVAETFDDAPSSRFRVVSRRRFEVFVEIGAAVERRVVAFDAIGAVTAFASGFL